VEHQRIAVEPLEMLDLANEDDVVACCMLVGTPADKMGNSPLQQGHPAQADAGFDARKPIYLPRGEALRDGPLPDRQHVDREARRREERRKARGTPREAPEDERGSRETEVNEFTVSPTRRPSAARVVTTVTPVANCPNAALNAAVSGQLVRSGRTAPRTLFMIAAAVCTSGTNLEPERHAASVVALGAIL
jgi:hypothetical protein